MREIRTKIDIGLHVKYTIFLADFNYNWICLADFNYNWIFLTDFPKSTQCITSCTSVQCAPSWSMRAERRTDVNNQTVAFRNFANAPKNLPVIWNLSVQARKCPTTDMRRRMLPLILLWSK